MLCCCRTCNSLSLKRMAQRSRWMKTPSSNAQCVTALSGNTYSQHVTHAIELTTSAVSTLHSPRSPRSQLSGAGKLGVQWAGLAEWDGGGAVLSRHSYTCRQCHACCQSSGDELTPIMANFDEPASRSGRKIKIPKVLSYPNYHQVRRSG